MKIGITGANGFIGWHLRCYLETRDDVSEVRLAGRNEFAADEKLYQFVSGLDCIVHLAGVNRAESHALIEGNIKPAKQLVRALTKTNATPVIIYSSSVQALNPDVNPYSESKAAVGQIFSTWSEATKGRLISLIIPHVFGEYGKPHYNSAVATFAHQVANGEQLSIHNNSKLELVHVQDLVERMIALYQGGASGDVSIVGHKIGVVEVAAQLQNLHNTYINDGQIPDLSDHFIRCLFNTLRGAFQTNMRVRKVNKYQDDRGWLVEAVKANSGGQCFVSTTLPGITRGNHFHRYKVERFFVLQGRARIQLRKLFNDDIVCFELDGTSPSYVDIPTLHTHSITNVGEDELITLFWADEFFDEDSPDTYFEEIVK